MFLNPLRLSAIGLLVMSGCASFSTTPITRLDSGEVSADSNGLARLFCRTRPFRGVPVKLKVQTHVDVWIEEDFVLKYDGKAWNEQDLAQRFLQLRTAPVFTDQVVISDFKRPASGTIDLTIDFTDSQYFKKIDSEITDTTITDSVALLGTIISKVAKPTAGEMDETKNATDFLWQRRTVAFQRFDINAVDYELQIEAFVNQHMNACNECSRTTYDRNQ